MAAGISANWVAHASRVRATVFHRRELFVRQDDRRETEAKKKFVAVEDRAQHAGRVRSSA